jgi:peptidoglycan/xylan/chitin deacetylase (PgdA/CDA1 family)
MKWISPLLKRVVYPGLSRAGYLRHAADTGTTVLTYHGVLPAGYTIIDQDLDGSLVSAESFRHQLNFLRDRYNVISPEEFRLSCEAGHELSPRSVLLTCDDGLRNSLTEMLPILQELDLPCLFFVTGASLSNSPTMLWYEELYLMFLAASDVFSLDLPEIGLNAYAETRQQKRTLWWVLVRKLSGHEFNHRQKLLEGIRMQLKLTQHWDAEYREDSVLSRRFFVLDQTELCQLAALANASIGAHTMSHPMLSQCTPEMARDEVSQCKAGLENALGQEVWALAYPFGESSSVSSREFETAKRAGYQCAFLNMDGNCGRQTPKFALPRMHITADMSLAEFEAHVSGFHGSLRQLFRPANMHASAGPAA